MLPNLASLYVTPGNVFLRCPKCASTFIRTSPTGCANCGNSPNPKRTKTETKKSGDGDDCGCESKGEGKDAGCPCDDEKEPQRPPGMYRYRRMYPDADPNSDEGRLLVANFVAEEEEGEDIKPVFRSTVAEEGEEDEYDEDGVYKPVFAKPAFRNAMAEEDPQEKDPYDPNTYQSLPASDDDPNTFRSLRANETDPEVFQSLGGGYA